jgi:peptidoglycan/xylan/chitin deacetylase (PgdA/CDA1 family)
LSSELVARGLRRNILADKSVVLMYHELAEDDVDIEAWAVVRKSDFVREIEYLRTHFDVVSLEEAITRQESADARAKPLAVVTFDDGDRGNADVMLPVVNALEIPVTVFVATRQIVEQRSYWFDQVVNALQTTEPVSVDLTRHGLGRYGINRVRGAANWEEMQRLLTDMKRLAPVSRDRAVGELLESLEGETTRALCWIAPMDQGGLKRLAASPFVTVGAHSHCHNILTELDSTAVEQSVGTSKRLLESWIGKEVWSFAYPNGDYDERVAEIVRRLGFRCAMTTGDRLWARSDSRYGIPRMAVGRYDSLAKFKLSLVGGWRNVVAAASRTGRPTSGVPARPADTQDNRV